MFLLYYIATVATTLFDEDNFNRIYEPINDRAKSFLEISSNLKSNWVEVSKSIEEKRNAVTTHESRTVESSNATKQKSSLHTK